MLTLDPQAWLTQQDPLRVVALRDPMVEDGGHHPRSQYVETFYLAILGPSSLVAARRLAAWLDASPDGFTVPLAVLARQLGLGTGTARNAPLPKTLARLAGFGLAAVVDGTYALRLASRRSRPARSGASHCTWPPPTPATANPRRPGRCPASPANPRAGEPSAARVRSGKPGPGSGELRHHLNRPDRHGGDPHEPTPDH